MSLELLVSCFARQRRRRQRGKLSKTQFPTTTNKQKNVKWNNTMEKKKSERRTEWERKKGREDKKKKKKTTHKPKEYIMMATTTKYSTSYVFVGYSRARFYNDRIVIVCLFFPCECVRMHLRLLNPFWKVSQSDR